MSIIVGSSQADDDEYNERTIFKRMETLEKLNYEKFKEIEKISEENRLLQKEIRELKDKENLRQFIERNKTKDEKEKEQELVFNTLKMAYTKKCKELDEEILYGNRMNKEVERLEEISATKVNLKDLYFLLGLVENGLLWENHRGRP